MMHKKGDVVQIRNDLKIGNEYGPVPIKMTYDMAEDLKTGTVGTVEDVMESEFAVKVGRWWWSEIMIGERRRYGKRFRGQGRSLIEQSNGCSEKQ